MYRLLTEVNTSVRLKINLYEWICICLPSPETASPALYVMTLERHQLREH